MPPRTPRARPKVSRRAAAIAAVAVLAVAAALVAFVPALLRRSPRAGPIVLISIDTLRADRVGAYGYAAAKTPAIDALAREGVLFERALSHSPQTLPSHASMLTGRLPSAHGVRDNVGFTLDARARRPAPTEAGPAPTEAVRFAPTDLPTLPAVLAGRGYRSGGFVSAFVLRPETGIARGFGHFDAELPPGAPGASMGSVRRDGADTIARAGGWLAAQPDGRFFLFVHLYEPHRPWHVPPGFEAASRYDAAISYADALVGRLVRALADRGFYDDALVVLLADHGEGLGDHGEEEHGVFLYDESVRIPFVVKMPGGKRGGTRVREPIGLVDLVPTLAEAAGAQAPAGLDGRSLVPLLEGRRGPRERGVYAEALYPLYHFGWSPLYSLTDARYRYVLAPTPELYDLERDPRERENIAASRPRVAGAMRQALEARITANPGRPSPVSRDERARFEALGYIGQASEAAFAVAGEGRPDPKEHIVVLERYREAVTLMGERRLPDAIQAFRDVVRDQPSMLDVWVQLGHALMRAGRHREAIDALARAVALDPGSTDSVLAIATAELRVGRLDAAAASAEAVLGREPARAREILARVALARGQGTAAMEQARLAQAADPTLPLPGYIEGALRHARGDYAAAIPPLQRAAGEAAARRVNLRDLRFTLGDALAREGRDGEAEREFLAELDAFPENGRARASLALLYQAQGRGADARRVVADLVEVTPTPESYQLAVRTLAIAGDRDEAAAVLSRGLRQFPGDRGLRDLAGQLRHDPRERGTLR